MVRDVLESVASGRCRARRAKRYGGRVGRSTRAARSYKRRVNRGIERATNVIGTYTKCRRSPRQHTNRSDINVLLTQSLSA